MKNHKYRVFQFPRLTPLTKNLLIGLSAAFVLQAILEIWIGQQIFRALALQVTPPTVGALWQIVTYVVVVPIGPSALLPFMINVLFLWFILAPFESRFGPKRTLQLCALSQLGYGLAGMVGGFLLGGAPLFGAGAWLLGAIAAFAASLPKDGVLSFFGLFQMRPPQLIMLMVGLSLLSFLLSQNFAGLFADLGAIGAGMLFIRILRRPTQPPKKKKKRKNGGRSFEVIQGGDNRPKYLN